MRSRTRTLGGGVSRRGGEAGLSLVELLVVIAVVGVITAIVVVAMSDFQRSAKITTTAYNLESFGRGFTTYYHMTGTWPVDTHNTLPVGTGIEQYLHVGDFNSETPLGGRYNWEGPSRYTYAGISLTGTTATQEELQQLDEIMDDGNLSTGSFLLTQNRRYTYIVNPNP